MILSHSDIYPEVGLLDYMIILLLICWETSILFSIVVAPTYISISSAPGSLFSTSSPAAAAAASPQSYPTLRPHGLQPTRLLHPWDSPGKNTGVGCHFLLQSMKVESESEVIQSCPTLRDPMDCSLPGSSIHGNSTGVGCHCLLAHPHQYFLFLVFWITPF